MKRLLNKLERVNKLEREYQKKIEKEIITALNQRGLPKSSFLTGQVARVMLLSLRNNKIINAKKAVSIVKKAVMKEFIQILNYIEKN